MHIHIYLETNTHGQLVLGLGQNAIELTGVGNVGDGHRSSENGRVSRKLARDERRADEGAKEHCNCDRVLVVSDVLAHTRRLSETRFSASRETPNMRKRARHTVNETRRTRLVLQPPPPRF